MIKIKFPYYSGNIKFKECLGLVDLDYFIQSIKNPRPEFSELFEAIKIASKEKNTKLKRSLKQKLYSFTPSVIIPYSKGRSYFYVKEYTGLMQIDFDGIETIEKAIELKSHVFNSYKQIVCSFLSPSGAGVKCLMRIKKPVDLEQYKAIHKAMENELEQYGYLDTATRNAVLPMFLSRDKDILYRDFYKCEIWSKVDYSKPKYIRLNEHPPTSIIKNSNNSDLFDKVVRIIKNRFSAILNNGHTQVRSTSLVLGSRVSAGYIDKQDAENLIKNCILSNNYLQKNINGYLKTAYWGIEQGMKSPKYF